MTWKRMDDWQITASDSWADSRVILANLALMGGETAS